MAESVLQKAAIQRQDRHFLEKVRELVHSAQLAIEEAEQYADDIKDLDLRGQAYRLLEEL